MRNWSNAGNNGESSAYFCSRQKMVFRTIANFFLSRGRLNRAFLNVVSFAPDLYAALTSRGWGEVNWYKASFKLYRFARKRNYRCPRVGLYDEQIFWRVHRPASVFSPARNIGAELIGTMRGELGRLTSKLGHYSLRFSQDRCTFRSLSSFQFVTMYSYIALERTSILFFFF